MTIYSDTPEEFSQKNFIQNFYNNNSSKNRTHNQIIRETELSALKEILSFRLSSLLQFKIGFLINNLKKITAQKAINNSDSINLPQNFIRVDKLIFSYFEVN